MHGIVSISIGFRGFVKMDDFIFVCVKRCFPVDGKKIEISDEENRLCVSSALFGLMSLLVFVTTLHKLFEYC